MDKDYWKKYYELHGLPAQPSLFAQFVMDKHVNEGDSLIELGCGNGRDSLFFVSQGVKVTAVDQCENEIFLLKEKNKSPNLNFICDDFTKLEELGPFDQIYSRFTLHSVSKKGEDAVIDWAYENLKKGGKLLIETRGKKNELYKLGNPVPNEPDAYILDNHYRRFVDIKRISQKLESIGFKIVVAREEAGFAPFGDTDYKFIRIIASKK